MTKCCVISFKRHEKDLNRKAILIETKNPYTDNTYQQIVGVDGKVIDCVYEFTRLESEGCFNFNPFC